jgi:uncharacterized protein
VFHVLKITYLVSLDVLEQQRAAHVAWIRQEIDGGRLILAGRQEDERRGAVLITADIGADEADNLIASDPYERAGFVSYERIGFNGAFRAPGL